MNQLRQQRVRSWARSTVTWRRTVATVATAGLVAGVVLSASAMPGRLTSAAAAAAAAVQAGDTTLAAAGAVLPGPTAPPPSEGAPPDPFADAPTANLNRLANALQVRNKSVTTVVTAPYGLGIGNRVEISVLFGSRRVTQVYGNGTGNRLVNDFPALDGKKRRENVTISLLESVGNGYATYSILTSVEIEPLFDIATGPLRFTLLNDCDPVGASEPIVRWRLPNGLEGRAEPTLYGGETATLNAFARTYREMGVSRNLRVPTFEFDESDWPFDFFGSVSGPVGAPLLPGVGRAETVTMTAGNNESCPGTFRYALSYQLRTYPDL